MDQVEEVKQKTDMVQLVGEYVSLKKAGRNYKGLCPFHGEKSPSFMVNPELQIFKCFGCGEGGDAFAFLQRIEGLSFGEALAHLAKRVGITLTSYKPNPEEAKRERLYAMHHVLAEAYHFVLTKHESGKAALEYVRSRQITDEAMETFRMGYVPERWDFAIDFLVKKKGYTPQELEQGGLVIPKHQAPSTNNQTSSNNQFSNLRNYYDRFRNRVMFPLANSRGQIVGFAGRVLPDGQISKLQVPSNKQIPSSNDQNHQPAKYINSPETEIYHKGELLYGFDITRSAIKLAKTAVVVEGEIDAIASWMAGVKNVVAIKGTALTQRQVEMLARVAETVVVALDADVAGDAAARRGIAMAEKAGLMVKVAVWEGGKDPGDIATADPTHWQHIVEEAIPVYDFYLDSAKKRYGLDVAGTRKISAELVPILAEISDEIIKAHYAQKLALMLGVREEDVRAQLQKSVSTKYQAPSSKQIPSSNDQVMQAPLKKTRREVLEEYLVGLAMRSGRLELLAQEQVQQLVQTPFWKKVLIQMGEIEAGASVAAAMERLAPEIMSRVQDLLLVDESSLSAGWTKEWERTLKDLEELAIKEELEQLKSNEEQGERVGALTRRLAELSRGK